VVIEVELLEVDRTKLREYGLQIASPGSPGISGSVDVNREGMTLAHLRNLTAADVFVSGIPGIYYRLLKNDTSTRTLANPQLRTAEGMPATRPPMMAAFILLSISLLHLRLESFVKAWGSEVRP